MELLQALILGIVQGLTEFLPISSSGHLILIPELLGWEGVVNSLSFDIALHLGSTVALVFFFWSDWLRLITAFFKSLTKGTSAIKDDQDAKLFLFLILGTIPAGLFGFIFMDYFETAVRSPLLIAVMLIVFGLLLYLIDHYVPKQRKISSIGWVDALFVGLAQALALVPGVSRSGVTITAGLYRKLDREAATRFSFLLSTPIIVAAGLFSLKDLTQVSPGELGGVFLVGFLAAAISGWLAIKVLLGFVRNHNFDIFVAYRLVLGLGIIIWVFAT